MAQFVLVMNQISSEQLEKAIEVKNKSGGKLSFVPHQTGEDGVSTSGMRGAKKDANSPELYNTVRFEWADDGASFGADIILLFGPKK